ncbi:MAG TPA: acetate/propionate family kinase [Rhodopila sp.]|jgi:acetate kinase|nr:acetate/propionate family kinase [Rhodopila sp.]
MTETGGEAIVLTLNSGSSSLKFGLYRAGMSRTETLLTGEADSIGEDAGQIRARDARGKALTTSTVAIRDQLDAIVQIERLRADSKLPSPTAVGHRIVHGGPKLRRHCIVDDEVMQRLDAAVPFAPLHLPPALAIIRSAREIFPTLPHMACFDTTFHADLPDVARVLSLPKELRVSGIQRYGFHGLSCESILHQLGNDVPDHVVIAHLGNGASVTAVKGGKSVDTSMGLTPTGGVIMGTRSGDLDPGVLIYLAREKNLDAAILEDLVDRRSGLLGISGVSSDMRQLQQSARSNPDARLAIDMFCYSVRKQIAAMIAALEGIDLIVFTGGIGENDEHVRALICAGLAWTGIGLDEVRNQAANNPISDSNLPCRVLVLPSQEDEQIARHSWALFPQRTV